jgi:hypothetical protein
MNGLTPWRFFSPFMQKKTWTVPWPECLDEQKTENERFHSLERFLCMDKILKINAFPPWNIFIRWKDSHLPPLNIFITWLNANYEHFSSLERKMPTQYQAWKVFIPWTKKKTDYHAEQIFHQIHAKNMDGSMTGMPWWTKIPGMNVFHPLNCFKMSPFPPWTFFGNNERIFHSWFI